MFRKIKKYYFKIYHLLKLLFVFIFSFFLFSSYVKAECINLYAGGTFYDYRNTGFFLYNSNNIGYRVDLEPNTYYTLYFKGNSGPFSDILIPELTYLDIHARRGTNSDYRIAHLPTSSTSSYTFYSQYTDSITYSYVGVRLLLANNTFTSPFISQPYELYLVKGDSVCSDTPTPEPTDNPLSSFITIFLDRFSYLASGIISNTYIFCFIVVIFSFCILELFFKLLHLQRRRKK